MLRWSRYVDDTLLIPDLRELDAATLASIINEYCTKWNVSVVLADAIPAAGQLYELQQQLRVPSYAPEPLQKLMRIHDKWAFYEQLSSRFPMPRTALIQNADDLDNQTAERIGHPFLLKPLNGEAGHGVEYFSNRHEALTYLHQPGKYREYPLIIQQFITGQDAGYCVISDNGRAIVDDTQFRDANDVRTFCHSDEITELGRAIIHELKYSGPAFIDLRKDASTGILYPLECNCRFWSTITANAWMGINYPDVAACIAIGRELPATKMTLSTYHLPGTVIRYFGRPRGLLRISRRAWAGFFQAMTDPLPHLASRYYNS